jgi:outer membrane protein
LTANVIDVDAVCLAPYPAKGTANLLKSPFKPMVWTLPARRSLLLLGCLLCFVFTAVGQRVSPATSPDTLPILALDDAIRIALANNYSIKIAQSQVRLAENNNTAGFAGMLPIVTGVVQPNFAVNNLNQEFFPVTAGGQARPPLVQNGVVNRNALASVQLAWTVFDGLGMFITRERLGELVRVGEAAARATIESTVAQVQTAYFDIARQVQRTNALIDALDISRQQRQLAQDRFEVGTGSKIDYLNAQVNYNTDTAALLNQRQILQTTKVTLNALLVRPLNTDFTVPDTILLAQNLVFESLRERLMAQNPQLQQARLNVRVSELDVKNQRALLYPVVDVLSGYAFNYVNNAAGFGVRQGTSGSFTGGLRIAANIFDGFNQRRRIQGARIAQDIAQQQVGDLQVQLESALEQSYINYRNSLVLLDLEARNLQAAQENVSIALERFRIGVSIPLELREAQRNAVAAETRLIDAQFNTKAAEIELLRLSSGVVVR